MATIDMLVHAGGIFASYASDSGEDEALRSSFVRDRSAWTFGALGGAAGYQANGIFIDERVIGASSSQTIDIRGALTNKLGDDAIFAFVRGLYLRAHTSNDSGGIDVGNGTNPFLGPLKSGTHRLTLFPGDEFVFVFGSQHARAILAGVNDDVLLENLSASQTNRIDFAIWGDRV